MVVHDGQERATVRPADGQTFLRPAVPCHDDRQTGTVGIASDPHSFDTCVKERFPNV